MKSMKNWLGGIFSYDPRKGSRRPEPPVEAFFWNGGKPSAHVVRNISPNGFYLVTEERWLEGTLIVMTLQRTANYTGMNHNSVVALSRVIHHGEDGVGFAFVPVEQATLSQLPPEGSNAANRKALDEFLHRLSRD
ncbi:MAG TPA: PilZ domain-containing protein [Acidobacteriaceae bacterium]|nr:PilZ domain-containing protein [Acidobacteriaceae bacterium]